MVNKQNFRWLEVLASISLGTKLIPTKYQISNFPMGLNDRGVMAPSGPHGHGAPANPRPIYESLIQS